MAEKEKIKLAFYWAASCGGCDVATLDIEEKIMDVVTIADIVFWPMAMDFKYEDVEEMEAGSIDVCLFNGAVRNAEHEEMAKLLCEKAKVMVAFGSCACFGGIPGLGNVANKERIYKAVYDDTPSTVNPEFVTPQPEVVNEDGKLTLPEFRDTVKTLDQVVAVDYYVPGCPPVADQVNDVARLLASYAETGDLPPKGAVVAFDKTLCDECTRERAEKKSIQLFVAVGVADEERSNKARFTATDKPPAEVLPYPPEARKPLEDLVHHGKYGTPFVELEPGRIRARVVGGFRSC